MKMANNVKNLNKDFLGIALERVSNLEKLPIDYKTMSGKCLLAFRKKLAEDISLVK